jgi:hypothetical protein
MKFIKLFLLVYICFISFLIKAIEMPEKNEKLASKIIFDFYEQLIKNKPFDKNYDLLFSKFRIEKVLLENLTSRGYSAAINKISLVGEFIRYNRHLFIPGVIEAHSRISINVYFEKKHTFLMWYKKKHFHRKIIELNDGNHLIDCFVVVRNHNTQTNKLSESILFFPLRKTNGNMVIEVYSLIMGNGNIFQKTGFVMKGMEKKRPILKKEKLGKFISWLKKIQL